MDLPRQTVRTSRGIRKYSIVLASANEFGGMMQTSALMSTNDFGSKFFGIDDGVVDVGEDLELVADADVVAVGRHAVGDDALPHLIVHERLDHLVLARHAGDPRIGFDGHRSRVVGRSRQRRKKASTSVSRMLRMIDVASGK